MDYCSHSQILNICFNALFISHEQCKKHWLKKKKKKADAWKIISIQTQLNVVRFDVLCYAEGLTFLKDLAAILQEVQSRTKITGGLFPHSCWATWGACLGQGVVNCQGKSVAIILSSLICKTPFIVGWNKTTLAW